MALAGTGAGANAGGTGGEPIAPAPAGATATGTERELADVVSVCEGVIGDRLSRTRTDLSEISLRMDVIG